PRRRRRRTPWVRLRTRRRRRRTPWACCAATSDPRRRRRRTPWACCAHGRSWRMVHRPPAPAVPPPVLSVLLRGILLNLRCSCRDLDGKLEAGPVLLQHKLM
uniref:Uncharacterized protein n=1 Tax=Triticum urartu TaxID=4572 RepID=A0A8R7V5X4_TRIUA